MNPETHYILFSKFQDLIQRSGLPFEELAGYVKVSAAKGRKIYIPRTQRVGRVDISGFEYPGTGVITLGDEAFGGVKQQLDFTGDEEATLENFINVLYHMTSLPPVESRTRSARGTGEIPTNTNESGPRRAGRPSMTDIIEDEKYIQARARTAAELANITKPVIRRRMAHSAR